MDFAPSERVAALLDRVREFMEDHVDPVEAEAIEALDREVGPGVAYPQVLVELRARARDEGLWNLFLPDESFGPGLTNWEYGMLCELMGRSAVAPMVFNCAAPDTGNMEILAEHGSEEQKERWLGPLLDGEIRSCFSMTEPNTSGSDPTQLVSRAELDGEEWVVNGHKWFISNARRASFAILMARTEDDPEMPQAANTGFIVELPSPGWNRVREIETMHGPGGHSEIVIEDLRIPAANMLGERGQGHRLGQYRLGPARLAHCMRWIAQAEMALDMMVDRSLNRFAHGSLLAEKQGIQWMIADSTMELYQAKLMVLHAAYRIDRQLDFKSEVSMAKHFVANALNRIIDRSIQVHGALGYSTDTPLANMYQHARWARFADGADEVHQMRIAQRTIAAYKDEGSTRAATGGLPI